MRAYTTLQLLSQARWGDGTLVTTSELSIKMSGWYLIFYTQNELTVNMALYSVNYPICRLQCALVLRKPSAQWCVITILDLNQQHSSDRRLVWGKHWWRHSWGNSVSSNSVGMTELLVSVTIDHCLKCQFKLSPWKRARKVKSKTSPHK